MEPRYDEVVDSRYMYRRGSCSEAVYQFSLPSAHAVQAHTLVTLERPPNPTEMAPVISHTQEFLCPGVSIFGNAFAPTRF